MKFYGMGTFNLAWSIGSSDAYGHVGDTYGYQSQTTYVPADDFVITVTWSKGCSQGMERRVSQADWGNHRSRGCPN